MVLCGLLSSAVHAAPAAAADPFAANGLTKSGTAYVLADEAAILAEMKALRTLKAEADKEVRLRTALDLQIAAKEKVIKDSEKTYRELEARLPAVTKQDAHNAMVLRMNRMVADMKAAKLALEGFDEQAKKLSSANKTKYVDELMKLNGKTAALKQKYSALAEDANVKASLAKVNLVANPKVTISSAEFQAAVDELNKWQSAIESEAIAMREENGTFKVEVLLNGEPHQMCVDTGATSVCLPFEVAAKLKLVPAETDPIIDLKLADGSVIQGRAMTLATVRVGRFTANNVECVVLQQGLPDPAIILGGSFLNRYIVNMDPSKKELQLTEVKSSSSTARPAAAPATPPK